MRAHPLDIGELKPLSAYSNKELTILLLKCVAIGFIVTSIIMAPNMAQAYAKLGILDDPRKRRRFRQKLRYLEFSGKIRRNGKTYAITEKGRRVLTEEEVWNMVPQKGKTQQGIHYFVLFDIPMKKERARQALRARLQELGMQRYQNSVFMSAYPVKGEVTAFAKFYGIEDHIRFITATEVSHAHPA